VTPYPDYARIEAAVRTLLAGGTIPWSGTLYRIVDPQYSNPADLISGAGAYRKGSRWNWPGLDHVVFGSTQYAGAFAEWESHATRGGVPFTPDKFQRDMRTFHVHLHNVLDFTEPSALPSLGIEPTNLLHIPWEFDLGMGQEGITHAVGRAVHRLGVEAVLVPCAPRPTLHNIVIYRSNLDLRSSIVSR
jgi:RES domain-containing protein